MGKNRNKSNDLTLQGYQILKKKVRSDGEMVVIASHGSKHNYWVLAHITSEGRIADSRVYVWYETSKRTIQKMANHDFKVWFEVLFSKNDEYEGINFSTNSHSKFIL